MEIGNSVFVNHLIPTPDGFKSAGKLSTDDYLIGNDGKPVRIKMLIRCDDDPVEMYRVSFKDRMDMVCPITQKVMTINTNDLDIKDISIGEILKVGPVTTNGQYKYQVPTSPRIDQFGPASHLDVEERVDIIKNGTGFKYDAVYGTVNEREETIDLLFKDGPFVTDNLTVLFMVGTIVRSLGYIFYVESKNYVYTCTMSKSVLENKVSTISGIEDAKETKGVVSIAVDNEKNMFIGPNLTLMYGYRS